MGPILVLLVLGIVLLAAVWIVAGLVRERRRIPQRLAEPVVAVNLTDNNNAVIVAEGHGHLVFANDKARSWFGMDGGEPNLELMAQRAQPAEPFIELFGKEGRASFQVGPRRVEATSYYVPRPDMSQLVVVMRELVGPTQRAERDPAHAMQVVGEIAELTNAGLRLPELLNGVLAAIAKMLLFDAGEINLWEADGQVLRPMGRGGERASEYFPRFDATDGVYHLDDSFSGWVARYRQPLLIADVRGRPDVHPKLNDYPFVSYIGIPLLIADRLIGTIDLGSLQRAAFDHEDLALLQAIGGQVAITIDNVRLAESQSEHVAELTGLQQIAQAVGSITEMRQIYGQLSTRIAELLNVEMCGILLYDAEQKALIAQIPFHNVADAIASMYRIPLDENSQAYRIWQNRDWWYTNNVQADDMVRSVGLSGLAEVLGVRTTALAPLIVGNRRIGAVQASNKRERAGFVDDDLRLLAVFASQTAIVVENARLNAEEQKRSDDPGNLQQINRTIDILKNPDDARAQVTARIARLMNVQICGVMIFDAERNMLVAQMPFFGVSDELIQYYELALPPGSPIYALYAESNGWFINDVTVEALARNAGLDKLGDLIGMRQVVAGRWQAFGRAPGRQQTEPPGIY